MVVLTPWKGVPSPIRKIAFSLKKLFLSGSEKSLFQVTKTFEIASRLFWRNEKASQFRCGKIAFLAEKAISFRFGKIAFSGRHVARNCVKVVLAPKESVPFNVRKNRLFCLKSDFFQVWKNRFFRSPRGSKLRQGYSGALKSVPF